MSDLPIPAYFFDDGIRFHCRRCGHCCTGAPGLIRLSAAEAKGIAAALGMSSGRFVRDCLVPVAGGGFSIRELADGRCLFYDNGCRIYGQRPAQCRDWPFWPGNLRSLHRWREATRGCPGVGTGPRVSRERILSRLQAQLRHLPDCH